MERANSSAKMEPAAASKQEHAWLVQRVRDLEAEKREAGLRSELQAERVARQLETQVSLGMAHSPND